MKFLHEVMNPEDVDFLAYCLCREYKFNFWLLLVGKGLNGKSIVLRLIEQFLEVTMFLVRHCIDFSKKDYLSATYFKRWQTSMLTSPTILFSIIPAS